MSRSFLETLKCMGELNQVDKIEVELTPVPKLNVNYEREKAFVGMCFELESNMNAKRGWLKEHPKVPFPEKELPHIAKLVGMGWPEASIEQMTTIFIALIWGFAFDDVHLEKMKSSELDELQKEFMNAFEDRKNSLEPKYVFYLDIIKEVYERLNSSTGDQQPMTKIQQERFKTIVREFFESGVEEAEIFKEGNKNRKDNSFNKFLEVRLKNGFYGFFQLISEIVYRVGDYRDPLMEEINKCVLNVVTLQNDILSFNKELLEKLKESKESKESKEEFYEKIREMKFSEDFAPKGNSVFQFQRHFKCSSGTAMKFIWKAFEDERLLFDEYCKELSRKYGIGEECPETRYIRSMRALITANQYFSKFYDRYQDANDLAARPKSCI